MTLAAGTGWTIGDRSVLAGAVLAAVKVKRQAGPLRRTPHSATEMAAAYRRGLSVREVGELFHISYSYAHKILRAHGVPMRRRGHGVSKQLSRKASS